MKRLVITSICILTLITVINYLPATYAVQIVTSEINGAPLLLAAGDEADEAKGDQGDEKKDEVPGIDRIAASVCYG